MERLKYIFYFIIIDIFRIKCGPHPLNIPLLGWTSVACDPLTPDHLFEIPDSTHTHSTRLTHSLTEPLIATQSGSVQKMYWKIESGLVGSFVSHEVFRERRMSADVSVIWLIRSWRWSCSCWWWSELGAPAYRRRENSRIFAEYFDKLFERNVPRWNLVSFLQKRLADVFDVRTFFK